jgi:ketosteroid isomerase-like protein
MSQALAASAASAVLASTAQAAAQACAPKGKVITRDLFDQYVALYNAADPAFASFYADDVVMETVPPLRSAAEVLRFRKELSAYVIETIHVEHYVADENGAAAQFLGEFRCIRDMPLSAMSGLFGKAVKKGQVLKQRGAILYGVKNGKLTFIRAFPPIILQDWA